MLAQTEVDHVVCLALDHAHDAQGRPRPERSSMYVANEYVLELRRRVGDKVLLGASVHPYDPRFADRVRKLVDQGAVLLKWLPSAQDIELGSEPVDRALRSLARLGPRGGPLPLLLHTGAEYAVPPADPTTPSLDFLSWSVWDRFWNRFRGAKAWRAPSPRRAVANLTRAVEDGAVVIFAHCGLPYFAPRGAPALEHSDFRAVTRLLRANLRSARNGGRFLADVSACCTPFRKSFFSQLESLPRGKLILGSDFPTPIFELSAGLEEMGSDIEAAVHGDLRRLIIPEGNLLDVNLRELRHAFGADHPMFRTFGRLCSELHLPAAYGG